MVDEAANKPTKPCNHEGNYQSAGVISIPGRDEVLLMTILYCKKCGAVMGKDIRIKGLAAPPVGVPMNLGGKGRN